MKLDPALAEFAAFLSHAAIAFASPHPDARRLGALLLDHAAEIAKGDPELNPAFEKMTTGAKDRSEARRAAAQEAARKWGPGKWDEIHAWAWKADLAPTMTAERLWEWLTAFVGSLPCDHCASEFAAMLGLRKRKKVAVILPRLGDLFASSVEWHNAVSTRVGNPTLTLERAREEWRVRMAPAHA